MLGMRRSSKVAGFSLLELLIVVVIIGMIAWIAVPRISRGARGAADSSVRANLAALRNAIDLYAAEHNGALPAQSDNSPSTFVAQLTGKTDIHGNVGSDSGVHIYGPYLLSGLPPLSIGPVSGAESVLVATTGPTADQTQQTVGWVYNSLTGDIIANCTESDETGRTYDTY